MLSKTDVGKQGEEMAVAFLMNKGFNILHRNWRHSHYEIDIVAIQNGVLHFVEVKFLTSKNFGPPEEKVTKKKFRFLCQAADEFLYRHPQYKHIRFDILSITQLPNAAPEYFFIEDVYL